MGLLTAATRNYRLRDRASAPRLGPRWGHMRHRVTPNRGPEIPPEIDCFTGGPQPDRTQPNRPTSSFGPKVAGSNPPAHPETALYDDAVGYHLLYLDEDWSEVTDTWHATLEAAMRQAEREYEGITPKWTTVAGSSDRGTI